MDALGSSSQWPRCGLLSSAVTPAPHHLSENVFGLAFIVLFFNLFPFSIMVASADVPSTIDWFKPLDTGEVRRTGQQWKRLTQWCRGLTLQELIAWRQHNTNTSEPRVTPKSDLHTYTVNQKTRGMFRMSIKCCLDNFMWIEVSRLNHMCYVPKHFSLLWVKAHNLPL